MNSLLAMEAPRLLMTTDRNITNNTVGLPGITKWVCESQRLTTGLLTDASALQDIYDLRLDVWEHSGNTEFVNRQLFPNGWYDNLDSSALHWITSNEEGRIVAAARLNLFDDLTEFPYFNAVEHLPYDGVGRFAFFSRLIVHPKYRSLGLSEQLFDERERFCEENGIHWSQVFINNPYVVRLFEGKGFVNIGKAEVSYHMASVPHAVNVFIKQNRFH
ncbi:MAG TPA: GNAT family N-acetyltransferase [Agriterribacter sp.]|nr:GNAT family N-acetyltransferase [Agriterribacter sp.]